MKKWAFFSGLIAVLCLICYFIGEIAAAPPINVQTSDLVGVWEANYSPDEFSFYDECVREEARGVREILILRSDGIYEQRIEKEGGILYLVEGRRWWIEQTDPSTVWLHLEKGIGYPYRIEDLCDCLSRGKTASDCEQEILAPCGIQTFNRVWSTAYFELHNEVILSIWRPFLARDIFLEYLLGDPDNPIEVRFHRIKTTPE